jgi:hypothetical protein
MRALVVAVAILWGSAAFAQDRGQGQITKYLRPVIGLYDQNGTLIRRAPQGELPKQPYVEGDNSLGQLRITVNGQAVFVRNSEVIVKGRPDRCVAVAQTARPAGQAVAGSEGIGSGMSNKSAPCVRHNQ